MKRWALLSGGKGAGKSSIAARVAGELTRRGVAVGGVLQEAIEQEGARTGYLARRVGGPEHAALARRGAAPAEAAGSELAFCSFVFDTGAFERARTWIQQAQAADVVVIDEVSKLEVAGQGHHDAIRDALEGRALVLLVVRADQLFGVIERFGLGEPVASLETTEEEAVVAFVDALAQAARQPR